MYFLTKTWHSKPYPFISPERPELSAGGRNVVVTGGGTGIGRAVAVACAKAGAKSVSILGRRSEALKAAEAEIPGKVLSFAIDLLDKDRTLEAFNSITSHFGKVYILVSNVGAYLSSGHLSIYKAEDLVRTPELNVLTTLSTVQAFIPLASSDATLINTTSDMA